MRIYGKVAAVLGTIGLAAIVSDVFGLQLRSILAELVGF